MLHPINLILIGFYILLSINLSNQIESMKIESLIIIHRHGDRTPLNQYPNDPYADQSYFPDGFGQLTTLGKLRMFSLGLYLRKHYSSFLTNDPLEVSARSSDAERCINSAQVLLAGLYPPRKHWVWNEIIKWQPIAVHSQPMNDDGMLHATAPCPRWQQVNQMVQQSADYNEYASQYKEFFDYLTLKSGTNITSLKSASLLNEILTEEAESGLVLPDWVDDFVLNQLDKISAKNHVFETVTRLQVRLRAGLLLEEITNIMKQRDKSNKKLFIYSTHDTKLASILSAMRVFNGLNVPYSASIIFEIYGENSDNKVFKLFYLNDTINMDVTELKIPLCVNYDLCPVKLFMDTVHDLLGLDWKHECALPARNGYSFHNLILWLLVISGDASTLMLYIILAFSLTSIITAILMLYLRTIHFNQNLHLRKNRIK